MALSGVYGCGSSTGSGGQATSDTTKTITDTGKTKTLITVNASVAYGLLPPTGGACTGSGICSEGATGAPPSTKAVITTITRDLAKPNLLTFSFSKAEVLKKDPGQHNFLMGLIANAQPYTFPSVGHPLTHPVYQPFNFSAQAQILPNGIESLSLDQASGKFIIVMNIQP